MINLRQDGHECLRMIKSASFFPMKTGWLKNHATSGRLVNNTTYLIKFDGTIAPYLQYLEEGTTAHDIYNAFGFALGNNPQGKIVSPYFGIGGRFGGYFHPGSTKHYHFIQNKTIDAILMYFVQKYNGEVRI